MKTAVIVVHGVCPTPRFQIQDAFATELLARLNSGGGAQWQTSVLWPPIADANAGPGDVHATALRLWQQGDDGDHPQRDAFDIFEGYWSPIDKNQTNVKNVLSWMAGALFAPLNAGVRLYASAGKTLFDLGYVAFMFCLAVLFLILAVQQAAMGFDRFSAVATAVKCARIHESAAFAACVNATPTLIDVILHPTTVLPGFELRAMLFAAEVFIGAFAATQFAISLFHLVIENRRRKALEMDRGERWWSWWFRMALLAVAAYGLWYVPFRRPFGADPGHELAWATISMVAFVSLIRAAMAIGQNFFVNFLGDVQIYTTHDENAKYYALRREILRTVESIVLQVLRSKEGDRALLEVAPLYDRVFIAGHSLGSAIAMDAIVNLHELYAEKGLTAGDWSRLRGLITFGTALEKTRFFFDVSKPTVSVSPDHWRDDVNGKLFTKNPLVLRDRDNSRGIYWANFWYFTDIVANEIDSFRSTVSAGTASLAKAHRTAMERIVARNARLPSTFFRPPWHAWVHSDYLGDEAFWRSGIDTCGRQYLGVADILTIASGGAVPVLREDGGVGLRAGAHPAS